MQTQIRSSAVGDVPSRSGLAVNVSKDKLSQVRRQCCRRMAGYRKMLASQRVVDKAEKRDARTLGGWMLGFGSWAPDL